MSVVETVKLGPKWLPLFWLRKIPRESRPYLDRYSLRYQKPKGGGGWRVYLHNLRSHDTEMHNHPYRWSFSIVLRGSYTETYFDHVEYKDALGQTWSLGHTPPSPRRVRWFNWIPASRYHQIAALHGDVWTLFIAGPKGKPWGYWVPGRGHVAFDKRNAERGISYAAQ
jgi:hypothetical protein